MHAEGMDPRSDGHAAARFWLMAPLHHFTKHQSCEPGLARSHATIPVPENDHASCLSSWVSASHETATCRRRRSDARWCDLRCVAASPSCEQQAPVVLVRSGLGNKDQRGLVLMTRHWTNLTWPILRVACRSDVAQ
jgi:hypothetical protein